MKQKGLSIWEQHLKLAKKEGYGIVIGDCVLIRRIPHNFEVTFKLDNHYVYYNTLAHAVERAMQMLIDKKLNKKLITDMEDITKAIRYAEKKVMDAAPELNTFEGYKNVRNKKKVPRKKTR